MLSEEEKSIINFLHFTNYCKRCIIRLLGQNLFQCSNILEFLESKNINNKLYKACPCRGCLDVLSDQLIDQVVQKVVAKLTEIKHTKYKLHFISTPHSLKIREHAIKIYLTEKFPKYYEVLRILPVPNFLRLCVKEELPKYNITLDLNTPTTFSIILKYEDDIKECRQLLNIFPETLNISSGYICKVLENMSDHNFKKNIGVPSDTPVHPVSIESIEFDFGKQYVGGRYLKLNRTFSQLIKNGEDTVEGVIRNAFSKVLGIKDLDEIKLSMCGKDPKNNRVLGNGRPFSVEIQHDVLNKIKLQELVTVINESPDVKVTTLRNIFKCDVSLMKNAEETAVRAYEIICMTTAPNVEDSVAKINYYKKFLDFTVEQKTPISKLLARTLTTRSRKVLDIHAETIPGQNKIFILKLVVESGLYISEFIHGDFNRTNPSIRSITGYEVDLYKIDLVRFDVDFPPVESIFKIKEEKL